MTTPEPHPPTEATEVADAHASVQDASDVPAPSAQPDHAPASALSPDGGGRAVAIEEAAAPPPGLPGDDRAEGGTEGDAANGHARAESSPSEEPGSPEEHAAEGGAAPGEKKRRRRRRRKKAGAHAGPEGTAPDGAVDAEAPDEAAAPIDGPTADHPDPRPKRKERKPGPPRERPPVNLGDIVFGKILEINDEAILVDIPGKAHAIFDRRELLISDDEDAARAAAPAPAAAPDQAAAPPASGEEVPSPAGDVPPSDVTSAEGLTSSVEAGAPAAIGDASEPRLEAPQEPPPGEARVSPPPPAAVELEHAAPKDPKVPRVVLEVGADFIGVVHNDGARGGLVVLTHHPHRAEKAKPIIEKAFGDKATLLALVTGVIKGGVEVDVDGVRAFAPGSHVDLRLGADLSHLVGKRLPFHVTQFAKRGRDVVLSRKPMLEEEARKARADALERLKVGEEIEGIVRSVVPFGAFVDIGGIEGLVPLKEMSHNRSDGPSDVFKAGEPTRVRVMMIDDKGKVWLSHKATIPDPWQQVAQKYAVGTRHTGKVVRLKDFGAFIELEPGVDGLIHTQDLSIKRIEDPNEVVKVGDAIEIVVSHVDGSQHKIALHPALQGEAASEAPQRIQPHKAVKAKVAGIEGGGLVVRILGVSGRNARGYVTAAGTGTPRGTELRKAFNVGQEIEAKVIEVDPRRGEVKLSIKALSEDQERNAYQQYRQQLKAEARFTFGDLLAKKGTTPSR